MGNNDKPLTPEKRAKRKIRRMQAREAALMQHITQGGLIRDELGRTGFFVPAQYDPTMPRGQTVLHYTP